MTEIDVQAATIRRGSGDGIQADFSGKPYSGKKPRPDFNKSIRRTSRNGPRSSLTRRPGIMRLKDFKNPSLQARRFAARDCLAVAVKIAPGENRPALQLQAGIVGCLTAAPWTPVSSQTPRKEPPEKGKKPSASQALQSIRISPRHIAWCRIWSIYFINYSIKLPAQSSKPRRVKALRAGEPQGFYLIALGGLPTNLKENRGKTCLTSGRRETGPPDRRRSAFRPQSATWTPPEQNQGVRFSSNPLS